METDGPAEGRGELDELDALGALASLAGDQPVEGGSASPAPGAPAKSEEAGGDEGEEAPQKVDAAVGRKPTARTSQKLEKSAPQKWVQCAKCLLWRKVPFTLQDADIPDDWECAQNVWDEEHNSCTVPQALTDEEIDEILAFQAQNEQVGLLQAAVVQEPADDDNEYLPAGSGFAGYLEGERGGRGRRKGASPNPEAGGRSRGKGRRWGGTADGRPVAVARAAGRGNGARPTSGLNGRRASSGGSGMQGGRRGGVAARGKGRLGRGLNEAAEALLGMVGEGDEEAAAAESGEEAAEEGERVAGGASAFPPGSFRPGKVVWAKVEGHDWWPARIVRRRAVPREVGAPPGGPEHVRTHIPVVFFTAKGIPGEATEGLEASDPAAAAAAAALGSSGEAEEAEYAWLPVDCMKPFQAGDETGNADGSVSQDANLLASVGAADAARRREEALVGQQAARNYEDHTDSDGGWGVQTTVEVAGTPRARTGRSGRGGRGRRGRGKGGRRGARGYRRGRGHGFEDDDDSESDGGGGGAAAADDGGASGIPKIVVEQIFGWRWPPERESQRQAIKSESAELAGDGRAMEIDADTQVKAAAGEEENEANGEKEAEFLVKYQGKAHVHNEWVPESLLLRIAKRKCINFKRRHEEPVDLMDHAWTIPQRLVARRCAPTGPGWEVLVKWCGQGYEACTWEAEGEGVLTRAEYQPLRTALWQRQQLALRRAAPAAAEEEAAALEGARGKLADLKEQPPWVTGAQLLPHQLQAVNWLRRRCLDGLSGLLGDEPGLGRTATVVAFVQCLRKEFAAAGPVLVVLPPASLAFWEGEFAFWAGADANVVSFAGTPAARAVVREHELWLTPASMDGRSTFNVHGTLPAKAFKADVVLAPYEAVSADASMLSGVAWSLIVVDERRRSRTALAKAHSALRESLEARHRLLLSQGHPAQGTAASLLQNLAFLQPECPLLEDLDELSEEEQTKAAWAELEPSLLRRLRANIGQPPVSAKVEVQLPVAMPAGQAECYRKILGRFYDVLADPKAHRLSSSRASHAKAICDELRKVVCHPFTVPEFAAEEASAEERLAASGKLPLLQKLLAQLRKAGRNVLLLSQDAKGLDVLEEHLGEAFGAAAVVRIDYAAPTEERHAAVQRFNSGGGGAFVFMQTTDCCGLGTQLPSIGAVVIHDSDWNPRADMQALQRCRNIGSGKVPVFRLLVRASLEEKLLQLAGNTPGMEAVYAAGHGHSRCLGGAAPLMEEILRWGTQELFQEREEDADDMEIDGASQEDSPDGNSRPSFKASQAIEYAEDVVDRLIETATKLAEPAADAASVADLAAQLEPAAVREWEDAKEDAAGDDEGEEDAEEKADEDEEDEGSTEGPAEGAAYWASLLGPYAGRLRGGDPEEDAKPARKRNRTERAAAAFAAGSDSSPAQSDDDDEDATLEGLDARKASSGLAGPADAGDDHGVRPRGIRGGGRGRAAARGRASRRRRLDPDDDDGSDVTEEIRAPGKRRKRLHGESRRMADAEVDPRHSEWARHERMMLNIEDPTTAEGAVADRACKRLEELTAELDLEPGLADMAAQAAKILMLQREEGEPPSDFQDYTLMALVCVAGFLSDTDLGEQHGIAALARRYGQDAEPLQQVFDFIMDSLDKYRDLHQRMEQLVADGTLSPATLRDSANLARRHRQDGVDSQQGDPDMDAFASKLSQIVHTDFHAQAMQSPLDLGQFQMPFLPADVERSNPALAQEFEMVTGQLREFTTRIALLDRVHSIKVKHIQEEYQKFMEKVRGKAQAAIDVANGMFQNSRNELTAQVDVLVHLMHSRFYYQVQAAQAAAAGGDAEAHDALPRETSAVEAGSSWHSPPMEQTGRISDAADLSAGALPSSSLAKFGQQVGQSSKGAAGEASRRGGSLPPKPPLPPQQGQGTLAHAGRASQEGKPSINGGLASIPAVQSGFNLAHSSGLAGAALANHQSFAQQQLALARQLNQQTQLPLQRLTQEQMAQVQRHLQTVPGYHPVGAQGGEARQEPKTQAGLQDFAAFGLTTGRSQPQTSEQLQRQAQLAASQAQLSGFTVQSGAAGLAHSIPARAATAEGLTLQPPIFPGRPASLAGAGQAEDRTSPADSAGATPSRSPSPPGAPGNHLAQGVAAGSHAQPLSGVPIPVAQGEPTEPTGREGGPLRQEALPGSLWASQAAGEQPAAQPSGEPFRQPEPPPSEADTASPDPTASAQAAATRSEAQARPAEPQLEAWEELADERPQQSAAVAQSGASEVRAPEATAPGSAWQASLSQHASLAPDGMSIVPSAPPTDAQPTAQPGPSGGGDVSGMKFLDLLQGSLPPQ